MQRPRGETRERIYRFVRERLLAGRPPTVREVQEAAGLRAVESARTHLDRLVADGRLAKEPGIARGYRLPSGAGGMGGDGGELQPTLVPMVGRVQAGGLSAAIEDPGGYVAVTSLPRGVQASDLFALQVTGESMRDVGILDGDVVIVRRGGRPRDGHIVVALVGDDATVKTLHYGKDSRGRRRAELHPENPDFRAIIPARGELEILGRVVEVRRSLV